MKAQTAHPAFSLIELLAVIAIVGVLIALAIPALASARRTARFTASLSDTRQMVTMLAMYTTDNRDTHPYIVAGQFEGLAGRQPVGPNNGLSPGDQMRRWHMTMMNDQPGILDLVYPQIEFWPDMRQRANESGDYQASVFTTATLFAAPAYFSDTQPIHDHQLRATRTTEIRYPSDKMIIYNWSSTWLNPPSVIETDEEGARTHATYSFGDGSVELLYMSQIDGPFVDRSFVSWIGSGFTTTDGLAGRDRR
ncbi:MAG: type II secretion system protein [Phycisphaerales bacterium]